MNDRCENSRVGFLTFAQMRSLPTTGSSTIRAEWVINHWPAAEQFQIGSAYGAVIFQKAYWLEYAEQYDGVKILDICDPDFLDWNSRCMAMARRCNAVTTSTPALAETIAQYVSVPVLCIPDRIDLDAVPCGQRRHAGNGSAETAVWFGYSTNMASLADAIPALLDHAYKRLVIVSEKPDKFELLPEYAGKIEIVRHIWNRNDAYKKICEGDVVLNFRPSTGRWRYKSENKTLLAWALGLPVATNAEELGLWRSDADRQAEADLRLLEVRNKHNVQASVSQYEALIRRLSC